MKDIPFSCAVERAERRRRLTAGVAAALMLLSILLSVAIFAKLGHHDCTGPNCSICAQLHTAEERLSGGGSKVLPAPEAALVFLSVLLHVSVPIHPLGHPTLITLKVELLH